jgi:hypothetical protein
MRDAGNRRRAEEGVPTAGSVSIRNDLAKALGLFLNKEKISGATTKEALISLVCRLVHYKEEGAQLFPELFVFDDSKGILKSLPNSERLVIGVGLMAPESILLALKRCAPLAQWGWSIYLLRKDKNVEYGLLRSGSTSLSLSASDLLIDHGDEGLPAIVIRHVSHSTIELFGACRNSLRIHFGAVEEPAEDPLAAMARFSRLVVREAPAEVWEPLLNFYRRLFAGVLKDGHGCLAAVMNRVKPGVPQKLQDGVIIRPALDVASRAVSLRRTKACEDDTRLRAAAALIRGMLNSDGITVFGADATVRAYRVFVRLSERRDRQASAVGGARRRAFDALCSSVGRELLGALFISQDGRVEYQGE